MEIFIPPSMSECNAQHQQLTVSRLRSRYALLRIFAKYGRVKNLDFLFHKVGPSKGKPRGFAFIEYSDPQVSLIVLLVRHELTPGYFLRVLVSPSTALLFGSHPG